MNHEEQVVMGRALSALQLMVDGVNDPDVIWGYRVALADEAITAIAKIINNVDKPIPMVLHCPQCHLQHIDKPDPDWPNHPHRSHRCQHCDTIWRPADVPTMGVDLVQTRGKDDNWPPCDLR